MFVKKGRQKFVVNLSTISDPMVDGGWWPAHQSRKIFQKKSTDTLLQLAEALLCSLVPSLVPCLHSLHTLLASTGPLRADTALYTAKCLANLRDQEWRALRLAEVLPGLNLLASCLRDEDPEDVGKFYSQLPEVRGLTPSG